MFVQQHAIVPLLDGFLVTFGASLTPCGNVGRPDPMRSWAKIAIDACGLSIGASKQVSQVESKMRYCGVGCSYVVWTRGRHILKIGLFDQAQKAETD